MAVERTGRSKWLGLCGVCALAFLVSLNALGNGFVQDDRPIIEWNTSVHGVSQLGTAVTSPYWPSTPLRVALYRPVTSASYAVDWSLWRGAPFDAARRISPEVEVPHLLYLATLGMSGRIDEVLEASGEVVRLFPENPTGWHFRANALAARGRVAEARDARLAAIRLDDGSIGWQQWVHLALIEFVAGNEEGAQAALGQARAQAPVGAQLPELGELGSWVRDGMVVGMPGI